MTIVLGVALIVCIVGVIMYVLATNGKLVRIGEIMFAFGLLAALLQSTLAFK